MGRNYDKSTLRNQRYHDHRHRLWRDHAENLGDEVGLADDKLESRLHNTFDHNVGHLEHQDTHDVHSKSKAPRVDVAAEVAAMLRSPQGMRQLIIANEILRRPEW